MVKFRLGIISDEVSQDLNKVVAVAKDKGLHAIEVQYFQGPRPRVSLRLDCAQRAGALKPFPGCGLSLKTPGLSLVWLWWVAGVAAAGAAALWLTMRRLAGEARQGRR